jgi:hypothetical protein
MPIIERTPKAAFDVFTDHVRRLVASTVSVRYPLIAVPSETKLVLSFREGNVPIAIPIDTEGYGRVFFYLGQALEAVADSGGYRLTTKQYWYRLQLEPASTAKAVLRWEYDATTERDRHARHHTQIAAAVQLGAGSLNLNKAHIPTGWVTFEEVIRFLIHDLGLAPPCGDDWPNELANSEREFFENFSGKRYRDE